jgi:Domain of unknown function (DUF4158)
VDHVRQALDLAAEVIPGYDYDRTLYRHHQVVREYYQILPSGKEARRVILCTLLRAVRTMDNPADMINAALEALFEVQLPSHRSAFSQLKLVPPSPTLSHLKVWQDHLAWLTGVTTNLRLHLL